MHSTTSSCICSTCHRCSTLCAPNLPKMRLCLTSQLLSCWSSLPMSIQETVGQPSLISFAKPLRNPIISGLYSRKGYYIMLPSRWVTNAAIYWKTGNGNPQEIIIIGPCLNEHLFQMLSKKKKTSWVLNTISQRIHTQHSTSGCSQKENCNFSPQGGDRFWEGQHGAWTKWTKRCLLTKWLLCVAGHLNK